MFPEFGDVAVGAQGVLPPRAAKVLLLAAGAMQRLHHVVQEGHVFSAPRQTPRAPQGVNFPRPLQ